MVLLTIAWLALLRTGIDRRAGLVVAGLWALPLALGPPLFSSDVYSYLAQGAILHRGHDPYTQPPVILAHLGDPHLLEAVSKFWRHTTAPYGPLFLELVGLISTVGAAHIVAGVLLCRALDLVGLVLLAIWVPRVAEALGADEARAGLARARLAARSARARRAGPQRSADGGAAGGRASAARCGAGRCSGSRSARWRPRSSCRRSSRSRSSSSRGGGPRAAPRGGCSSRSAWPSPSSCSGVVTLASGVGLRWLSSSVFSTPARVHLAITPATALGETVSLVLHGAGIGVSAHGLEGALGVVATVLAAARRAVAAVAGGGAAGHRAARGRPCCWRRSAARPRGRGT